MQCLSISFWFWEEGTVCEEGIVANHFSRKLAWRDNEDVVEVEVEVEVGLIVENVFVVTGGVFRGAALSVFVVIGGGGFNGVIGGGAGERVPRIGSSLCGVAAALRLRTFPRGYSSSMWPSMYWLHHLHWGFLRFLGPSALLITRCR